jgi:hypothetical protein
MASLSELQADVMGWLKRRDIADRFPSWILQVETDIAELLRARCMVSRAVQAIDADFISLPSDFITFESVRFACCGDLLALEDHWSGPRAGGPSCKCGVAQPSSAYRLVGDCIEFLPHPTIPDPPDPNWTPQQVKVAWYARPVPLKNAADTNKVLENLYSVYLFGAVRYGAMYGLDDDREAQMTTRFQQAVMAANLWKEESQYSGAPLRAVVSGGF